MPRQRRVGGPEPPYPPWVIDNIVTRFHARAILKRLDVRSGMRVLDLGAGPGRLTIPLARLVGRSGEVVAVDISPKMIERLERRASKAGIDNIRTIVGGAGTGVDAGSDFDLAIAASVLGEIDAVHRGAAFAEVNASLKPGAVLAVVEAKPDPDFQRPETVLTLAEKAGFQVEDSQPLWMGFIMRFVRPHNLT